MASSSHVNSLASSLLLDTTQVETQHQHKKKHFFLCASFFTFFLFQADIFFVTASVTLHAHKAFLLPLLPSLASISCISCPAHQPLVLLLPGADAQLLQVALDRAYRQNQVGNLANILGLVLDLPCNNCDQQFESKSEMKAHICEKKPNFTCNLCGTMIQPNNGLNGHYCESVDVDGDSSKVHTEESQALDKAEEPIAKQESSELKRANRWQSRTKKNSTERKSDENQVDEETGQSLKLQHRLV